MPVRKNILEKQLMAYEASQQADEDDVSEEDMTGSSFLNNSNAFPPGDNLGQSFTNLNVSSIDNIDGGGRAFKEGDEDSSDCDVDEHGQTSDVNSSQKSPPQFQKGKGMASLPRTQWVKNQNAIRILQSKKNLSEVMEEQSSCSNSVILDTKFMSPDLQMKHERIEMINKSSGTKAPPFRQPKNKTPIFSLSLKKAIDENQNILEGVKEDEDNLPSDMKRRILHQSVASDTSDHLEKLSKLKIQQLELARQTSSSMTDDSSQLQSYEDVMVTDMEDESPVNLYSSTPESLMNNISPVKAHCHEDQIIQQPGQIGPQAYCYTIEESDSDDDGDEIDGKNVRFEMYSPKDDQELTAKHISVPYGVHQTKQTQQFDDPFAKKLKRSGSMLDSMKSFLVDKKTSIADNVNGFFEKLDDMEKRLKVSQEQLERQEEQKAQNLQNNLEQKMAQPIDSLNEGDRAKLSRSSGKTSATSEINNSYDLGFSPAADKGMSIRSEHDQWAQTKLFEQQIYDSLNGQNSETTIQQNKPPIGKKKKFVKRIVRKQNPKKEEAEKKRLEETKEESTRIRKGIAEISSSFMDVMNKGLFF